MFRNLMNSLDFVETNDFLKSMIQDNFIDAEIYDVTFTPFNDTDNPFEIRYKFEVDNVLQKQGKLCLLNFDSFRVMDDPSWLLSAERKYPVYFEYPCEIVKQVEISYPPSCLKRMELPSDVEIKKDEYEFSKNTFERDNKIFLNETYVVKEKMVEKDKYEEIKKDFSLIQDKSKEKLIFRDIVTK